MKVFNQDDWFEWIGLPAAFSIVPSPRAIFAYGIAFEPGWPLDRQMHLLLDFRKSWLIYFILAMILRVVKGALLGC